MNYPVHADKEGTNWFEPRNFLLWSTNSPAPSKSGNIQNKYKWRCQDWQVNNKSSRCRILKLHFFLLLIAPNLAVLNGSFLFYWNVSMCTVCIKSLQSVLYPPPQQQHRPPGTKPFTLALWILIRGGSLAVEDEAHRCSLFFFPFPFQRKLDKRVTHTLGRACQGGLHGVGANRVKTEAAD